MRNLIFILTCIFFYNIPVSTQTNAGDIFMEIEKNNSSLKALRQQINAQKLANQTDLMPANPELGFNYLWGSPAVIGNRQDVLLTQSFDFPTSYKIKKQISKLKNEQIEYEFIRQKNELIFEVWQILAELKFLNTRKTELLKRIEHFKTVSKAYQSQVDKGQATIIDLNKAKYELIQLQNDLRSVNSDQMTCLEKITGLNGGMAVGTDLEQIQFPPIPDNFEEWFDKTAENNPVLIWIAREIGISGSEEHLAKSLSLPSFNAGYMSESVTGESFHGITLGLTLPLWENKNKVAHARAQTLALEKVMQDQKLSFYYHLKSLHAKIKRLESQTADFRSAILKLDSETSLYKTMEMGKITIIEYILELSFYYASMDRIIEMEKELNFSKAELYKFGG